MCGIAGILELDRDRPVDAGVLRRMIAPLAHRGPDGTGFYTWSQVGLAHSRLSIIDLEGGAQPIHNEDRTVWTVFNGEIFNYVELRAELERRGHRFYTHTDTEVIVHLYEDEGESFVQRLNGQFAIAIWDQTEEKLILVRDRPGILPLFFTRDAGRLIFGSEVKAILPAMTSSPSMNLRALDQIMTFWAPSSPDTIFEGVEEVGPGEMLIASDGEVRRRRYWDWRFPAPGEHRVGREDVLTEELHELLLDATRLRLRSDVPVGAYLSGGLDSSTVVALLTREDHVSLRTFSLSFEDQGLDESTHQRRVVEHLTTDHHEVRCSRASIAERFPDVIRSTETPILRTAPVPMGILSGLVHDEGYRVVLTGEGADEVLGGYDIFKEAKIRQFWARRPDSAFRASLLRRLYPYLELNQRQSDAYLRKFFGQALDTPDLPYFAHVPRWTTTAKTKEFFSDSLREALSADPIDTLMARMPAALPGWHPFNRAQYIEAKSLMAGYLLSSQGDRMLMSNSVEGRFPYLDHRLMEFANSLHPKHKMRVLREKVLLKRLAEPYLPDSTVERHKQPYRAPDIASFMVGGRLPEYAQELMSPAAVREANYFDPLRVTRLLNKTAAGRAIGAKDNMAFVGILSTQLWHHLFVKGYADVAPETVAAARD